MIDGVDITGEDGALDFDDEHKDGGPRPDAAQGADDDGEADEQKDNKDIIFLKKFIDNGMKDDLQWKPNVETAYEELSDERRTSYSDINKWGNIPAYARNDDNFFEDDTTNNGPKFGYVNENLNKLMNIILIFLLSIKR